jgi:hypothetical protein
MRNVAYTLFPEKKNNKTFIVSVLERCGFVAVLGMTRFKYDCKTSQNAPVKVPP